MPIDDLDDDIEDTEVLPDELDDEELVDLEDEEIVDIDDADDEVPLDDLDVIDVVDAVPVPIKVVKDDDEDEDEEEDFDEVEASLDVILKERLVVDDEDDDDEDTDDRGETTTRVLPKQPGEFVCQSCFLVKRASQLADADAQLCRDCV